VSTRSCWAEEAEATRRAATAARAERGIFMV
jgi:hypothetical protein